MTQEREKKKKKKKKKKGMRGYNVLSGSSKHTTPKHTQKQRMKFFTWTGSKGEPEPKIAFPFVQR